jgi:hypothetical protein
MLPVSLTVSHTWLTSMHACISLLRHNATNIPDCISHLRNNSTCQCFTPDAQWYQCLWLYLTPEAQCCLTVFYALGTMLPWCPWLYLTHEAQCYCTWQYFTPEEQSYLTDSISHLRYTMLPVSLTIYIITEAQSDTILPGSISHLRHNTTWLYFTPEEQCCTQSTYDVSFIVQ